MKRTYTVVKTDKPGNSRNFEVWRYTDGVYDWVVGCFASKKAAQKRRDEMTQNAAQINAGSDKIV
jgi:hypothetical protein